jgi:hypothetical protein
LEKKKLSETYYLELLCICNGFVIFSAFILCCIISFFSFFKDFVRLWRKIFHKEEESCCCNIFLGVKLETNKELIIILEYSFVCFRGPSSLEIAIGDHGSLEVDNLSFSMFCY